MTTTQPLNELWAKDGEPTYENKAILSTTNKEPLSRALFCGTSTKYDTKKSLGSGAQSYHAQRANIIIVEPHYPPYYIERLQLDPAKQQMLNQVEFDKYQRPDPRANVTGIAVPYDEKLKNMDLQIQSPNWTGILGVVGIVLGIMSLLFLLKK